MQVAAAQLPGATRIPRKLEYAPTIVRIVRTLQNIFFVVEEQQKLISFCD